LKEEHGLTVYENRMQRKMHGSKRDEVTGKWVTLHDDELCGVYASLCGGEGSM
jgi:hypothetical protein